MTLDWVLVGAVLLGAVASVSATMYTIVRGTRLRSAAASVSRVADGPAVRRTIDVLPSLQNKNDSATLRDLEEHYGGLLREDLVAVAYRELSASKGLATGVLYNNRMQGKVQGHLAERMIVTEKAVGYRKLKNPTTGEHLIVGSG
jgi:hypothetical protein